MMRNVLMHNGARLNEILNHIRDLLAPGGSLLSVEANLDDLVLPDEVKRGTGTGNALGRNDENTRERPGYWPHPR